jgi:asparagine synthase (glutamine-hydrolysing)
MSGFAGHVHLAGAQIDPEDPLRMTALMASRGPDGISHWVRSDAGFGHCMLHTTPESLEEKQPLCNNDGSLVLVGDIRLDNWLELRHNLITAGVHLRSRADSELVLRAYETWGLNCLQELTGDFAFVIWHVFERKIFVARDRMGNKSLFYYLKDGHFAFATELPALLACSCCRGASINMSNLERHVLGSNILGDASLWQDIMAFPASNCLSLALAGEQWQKYWKPDPQATLDCNTEAEYAECYRALFADLVRRQSRSHLPLAIEVSGGLDSSAIMAMAAHLHQQDELNAPGFTAWTLDCGDDRDADERHYARAATAHWGLHLHEVPAFRPKLDWYVAESHRWRDLPSPPNGPITDGMLFAMAASGSRVVLNGLGGDEWLWGSRAYYEEELRSCNWPALRQCWHADRRAYGSPQACKLLLRHGLLALLPLPWQEQLVLWVRKLRGYQDPLAKRLWLSHSLREIYRNSSRITFKGTVSRSGQQAFLAYFGDAQRHWSRQQVDRDYVRHQLEPRSPLYSAEMLQFALAAPERMWMHGDSHKYLHVQALKALLPETIILRRSKADFGMSFHLLLDQMQGYFCEDLPARRTGWVDKEGMKWLYNCYRDGSAGGWPQWYLWNLYTCDLFLCTQQENQKP